MENAVIPQQFIHTDPYDSPPPVVAQFRNKRVCSTAANASNSASSSDRQNDIEPGEIAQREQPSADSRWMQADFKLSEQKVAAVIEFAKAIQLTEQHARDAIQSADHIRRTKAGNASTLDPVVSRFFSTIHDQEGDSNVGSLTFLLSVACLAFTENNFSASRLLGEFHIQGKEFRNSETLRKTLNRKNSLIPNILRTD